MKLHKTKVTRYGKLIYFKCIQCSYTAIYDPDDDELKIENQGTPGVIHSADPTGLVSVKLRVPKSISITFSCALDKQGFGKCKEQCKACKP